MQKPLLGGTTLSRHAGTFTATQRSETLTKPAPPNSAAPRRHFEPPCLLNPSQSAVQMERAIGKLAERREARSPTAADVVLMPGSTCYCLVWKSRGPGNRQHPVQVLRFPSLRQLVKHEMEVLRQWFREGRF